jgi:hypothetical protein
MKNPVKQESLTSGLCTLLCRKVFGRAAAAGSFCVHEQEQKFLQHRPT